MDIKYTLCSLFIITKENNMAEIREEAPELAPPDTDHPVASVAASKPLFITVGPPACGKTFWLSSHGLKGNNKNNNDDNNNNDDDMPIYDISLDSQRDVYIPVHSEQFLACGGHGSFHQGVSISQQTTSNKVDAKFCTCWFGRSLKDRIRQENVELMIVAKRCAGILSKDDMQTQLRACLRRGANHNDPRAVTNRLIQSTLTSYEALFTERGSQLALPATTDVFVREAIFQPHPVTHQSALDAAHHSLSIAPPHQPISWGNTNAKSSDYRAALLTAAQQGRPVFFVVYNALQDLTQSNDNNSATAMETDLEAVQFEGLLRRNLNRYLETGRYIPVRVIWDMLHRTSLLLEQVLQRVPTTKQRHPGRLSRLERDQILVSLAGLRMEDDRIITQQKGEQSIGPRRNQDDVVQGRYHTQNQRPHRFSGRGSYPRTSNRVEHNAWRMNTGGGRGGGGRGRRGGFGGGRRGGHWTTQQDGPSRPFHPYHNNAG